MNFQINQYFTTNKLLKLLNNKLGDVKYCKFIKSIILSNNIMTDTLINTMSKDVLLNEIKNYDNDIYNDIIIILENEYMNTLN